MVSTKEQQRSQVEATIADLENAIEIEKQLYTRVFTPDLYWHQRFKFVEKMKRTGWRLVDQRVQSPLEDRKLLHILLFVSSFHSAKEWPDSRRHLSERTEMSCDLASVLTGISIKQAMALHNKYEDAWLRRQSINECVLDLIAVFKQIALWTAGCILAFSVLEFIAYLASAFLNH